MRSDWTKSGLGQTEEDREVLEALEKASNLTEPYVELARIANLVLDEPETYWHVPPPLDLGFRDRPAGIVFNKTKEPLTSQL